MSYFTAFLSANHMCHQKHKKNAEYTHLNLSLRVGRKVVAQNRLWRKGFPRVGKRGYIHNIPVADQCRGHREKDESEGGSYVKTGTRSTYKRIAYKHYCTPV